MDKADADFLQHLFRENNALRARYTALQRELYNKTNLLENAEEEIKQLRIKIDQEIKPIQRPQTAAPAASGKIKDLEEAMFSIERQQAEIKQLREELNRSHTAFDDETEKVFNLTRENTEMATELRQLREFRDSTLAKEAELAKKPVVESTPEEIEMYQQQIKDLEAARLVMKQQMMEIALEANRVHNAQQNQLQGVEGLIEGIRREYDEFIQITKLENESFRALQQAEYESLKTEYEEHKNQSFEEKKRLTMEYQNILSAMQTQFDEYRATAELLFNVEMVKLEDEIASQASRYEQEIMYVIQAKDKFYSDMMVAKDAKIMGLIEGSDLQSIMQKHEMDMENARKEHAKELERVKSEHDSESKNVILLLQRQNVSLESKTEKLQTHLKSMEARMKELMNTIDLKNKTIAERDEARQKMEQEHHKKLGEANDRIATLAQEKEHLRHKVIRLNLNAKGEGENSIENMLKRLTRDTTSLHAEFEELGTKYDTLLNDNQGMSKQIKEKEKMVEFLEKELARRTQEFSDMVLGGNQLIRARIPDKGEKLPRAADIHSPVRTLTSNVELERGYVYLKRFKNLSRAFATGEFRALANTEQNAENMPGPWQKVRFLHRPTASASFARLTRACMQTPLYAKLDDASLAIAKVYREQPQKLAPLSDAHGHKPLLYIPPDTNRHLVSASGAPVRVYNEKMSDAEAQYKATRAKSTPRELDGLIVGGTHAV
nr:hypothetical protein HK105_007846 [Polyrhizophydium stewartii]